MFKFTSALLLLAIPVLAATCPPNQVVDGRQCTVTCSQDRPGGDFAAQYTGSFQGCINACAANAKCLTAQYHEANGYCYLKNSINPAVASSGTDSLICGAAGSKSVSPSSTSTTLVTSKSSTASPISSSTTQIGPTSITSDAGVTPTTDPYDCQDGLVVTGTGGAIFVSICNAGYRGTLLQDIYQPNLLQCEQACFNEPACVVALFYKPQQNCFLFSDITEYRLGDPDFDSGLFLIAIDPPSTGAVNAVEIGGSDGFEPLPGVLTRN